MEWVNANIPILLAAGFVGLVVWWAFNVSSRTSDLFDVVMAIVVFVVCFLAGTELAPAMVDRGVVSVYDWIIHDSAAVGLLDDAIGTDFNDGQPRTEVASTESATASRTTSVSDAGTRSGTASSSVQVQAEPEPERVPIFQGDVALSRWLDVSFGAGTPSASDIVTVNGKHTARSIPDGVVCRVEDGSALWDRASKERWAFTCTFNAESITVYRDGNWGRHYTEREGMDPTYVVYGSGPWPDYVYEWVTPADPVAGYMSDGGEPLPADPDPGPAPVVEEAPEPSEEVTIGVDPAPTVPLTHTVTRGDNLSKIAKRYFNDAKRWRDICSWNNLSNCNVLVSGMVLRLEAP